MTDVTVADFIEEHGLTEEFGVFNLNKHIGACPFCLNEKALIQSRECAMQVHYWVECEICHSRCREFSQPFSAINEWNRIRVTEDTDNGSSYTRVESQHPCPFCGAGHVVRLGSLTATQILCSTCFGRGPQKMRLLDALREWDSVALIVKSARGFE